MSEPTSPAGATPAAGGAMPPQTPPVASAPDPTPQAQPPSTLAPDPSAPDDAQGLGDAGKRALDAMKAERNAAFAAAKAAERELEQLKTASLSETEKAIAAARKAGADEVTERLHARVRRAEVKLALGRAGAMPSLIEDLANAAEFAAHRARLDRLPRLPEPVGLAEERLIDRFGGSAAVGRKAAPGPLYGISRDVWSALAIAVTYTLQSAN